MASETPQKKRFEFMGWVDELPPKGERTPNLDEYDMLRLVLMAEETDRRYVVFACADVDHAKQVVQYIKREGFAVEIANRGGRVYARRK